MQQDREDDLEFIEAWAEEFPSDSKPTRMKVYLRYNGIDIRTFFTVSIDGARMHIPYPNGDMEITYDDYKIGRIVNIPTCRVVDQYDDYLRRTGIMVQEDKKESGITFLK